MPSETCCSLLREAVKNGRVGLCTLYASSEIFKAFNINGRGARRHRRVGQQEGLNHTSPHPIGGLERLSWPVFESALISGGGVRPDIYTELIHNMVKAKGSA
ncbi:hypothetical protein ZWY2020_035089 [Hordeum vulgare]|nr:hypothetical protein ZWY2020_035089 [Hordeum vulgare]